MANFYINLDAISAPMEHIMTLLSISVFLAMLASHIMLLHKAVFLDALEELSIINLLVNVCVLVISLIPMELLAFHATCLVTGIQLKKDVSNAHHKPSTAQHNQNA